MKKPTPKTLSVLIIMDIGKRFLRRNAGGAAEDFTENEVLDSRAKTRLEGREKVI